MSDVRRGKLDEVFLTSYQLRLLEMHGRAVRLLLDERAERLELQVFIRDRVFQVGWECQALNTRSIAELGLPSRTDCLDRVELILKVPTLDEITEPGRRVATLKTACGAVQEIPISVSIGAPETIELPIYRADVWAPRDGAIVPEQLSRSRIFKLNSSTSDWSNPVYDEVVG